MATIKSYTDIEQSFKLIKILPLESADMCYKCIGEDPYDAVLRPYSEWKEEYRGLLVDKEVDVIPCWSLAALLDVLPNKIVSHETAFEGEDAEGINDIYYKRIESTEDGRYICRYSGNGYKYKYVADNLVDACYELILKLHELNLL